MTIFSSTEQVPLLVKISDTDVEYTRKSICGAATEKATQLPRLLAILLPYLLVVFVLTAFVFLGGTYGHRIESRNLKMIARSWDPTKPRWYQLIRVASGYEIEQSDGAFQNLSYPECTSFEVHRWQEVNVTDYDWLLKYQQNGTAFHRDVFALVRPNQNVATILCPPSTFLGTRRPVDFH